MKFIIVMLLLCLSIGCVSAKYDPEEKAVSYFRFGDQEFNGFEAVLPDGSYISFEHQKSDSEILAQIIKGLLTK